MQSHQEMVTITLQRGPPTPRNTAPPYVQPKISSAGIRRRQRSFSRTRAPSDPTLPLRETLWPVPTELPHKKTGMLIKNLEQIEALQALARGPRQSKLKSHRPHDCAIHKNHFAALSRNERRNMSRRPLNRSIRMRAFRIRGLIDEPLDQPLTANAGGGNVRRTLSMMLGPSLHQSRPSSNRSQTQCRLKIRRLPKPLLHSAACHILNLLETAVTPHVRASRKPIQGPGSRLEK